MLPNFIIPGAQKSGTTALRIYLSQHPEIYIFDKEIHFFDRNYDKGVEWYSSFFPSENKYKSIGEKTPEYMYIEEIPKRIFDVVKDVKLIFLLRNPIDRAYSNYWHNKRIGKEKNSFEKAVKIEEKRLNESDYNKFRYSYKDRGKYILQIKRFDKFFSKKQMLFLLSEDLNDERIKTLGKVLEFLEVKKDFKFPDLSKKFVGGKPKSEIIAKMMGSKTINKIKPVKYFLSKINVDKTKKAPMKQDTRNYLKNYFKEYNKELKKFTGLNLDKWDR